MEKVGLTGDYLGPKNTQAIYAAFATLLRKKNLSVRLVNKFEKLDEINTKDKEHESVSILGLHSGAAVFYTVDYENEIVLEDSKNAFNEIKQSLWESRFIFPDPVSVSLFRTPVDIVFTNRTPEREFIAGLIEPKNAACVTSWFKSKNQNFYSIEYSFTKGTHTNTYQFNPDFFVLIKKADIEYISVIEIKSDDDDNEENRQKYFYATRYFDELNEKIIEESIQQKYFFNFLSPANFTDYFTYLRDDRLIQGKYKSDLDNMLEAGLEE